MPDWSTEVTGLVHNRYETQQWLEEIVRWTCITFVGHYFVLVRSLTSPWENRPHFGDT